MKILWYIFFLIFVLFVMTAEGFCGIIYYINTDNHTIKAEFDYDTASVLEIGNSISVIFGKNGNEDNAVIVDKFGKNRFVLKLFSVDGIEIGEKISVNIHSDDKDTRLNQDDEAISKTDFISECGYTYKLTTKGFRSFLEQELRSDNPAIYNELNKDIQILQVRDNLGTGIMVVGVIVGGAICLVANAIEDGTTESEEEEVNTEALGLKIKGALIMLGIGGLGYVIHSDESDIKRLVDKHNKLNQNFKLNLGLGSFTKTKQNNKKPLNHDPKFISLEYAFSF